MDALALARWQFAITTVYHFFFVPLTLGLAWLLVIMQTIYVVTGLGVYRTMTRFWGKLFVVNFAMGVVTGIVQEFQFGMNWSEYSRFVGDVFGAPLAIEALLAFFLESTFLGVWIFGWDRLPRKVHLAPIWLVAIASTLSALWILIANSFMQEPVGYALEGGRAVMTDFFALFFNPSVWVQFPHVLMGGLVTGVFFVMGISAYHLLRRSDLDVFRRSFQIAAMVGIIPVVLVALTGHSQAQHMVEIQPMKMAAAEGLFETEDPASFSLLTIGDLEGRREVFAIRVPRLLSLLAYNQLSGAVRGINDLQAEYAIRYGPGNYVPPAWIAYWSFRLMVGAGVLLLILAAYALFVTMGEMLDRPPRLLRLFPLAIALPYLASTMGWLLTETGRFPWVVYGVMRIDEAVSPTVSGAMVATSFIGFTLTYGALMVAAIYLLAKQARAGAAAADAVPLPQTAPSLLAGS
ncbi:MAG: cytochrome ubiquinol oxidase subunit I [Chloroflexota bacterium]